MFFYSHGIEAEELVLDTFTYQLGETEQLKIDLKQMKFIIVRSIYT